MSKRKAIIESATNLDSKKMSNMEVLDFMKTCGAKQERGLSMLDVYQEQYKEENKTLTQAPWEQACKAFHITYPNTDENEANRRGPPVRVCFLYSLMLITSHFA